MGVLRFSLSPRKERAEEGGGGRRGKGGEGGERGRGEKKGGEGGGEGRGREGEHGSAQLFSQIQTYPARDKVQLYY